MSTPSAENRTPDGAEPGVITRPRFPEDGPWEVAVHQRGSGFTVYPHKGLLGCENWALTLNPRRSTSFLRVITGIYIRRQWPNSEKSLRKAIADCEEWCRRHNEAEAQAKAILDRTHFDRDAPTPG